MAIRPPCQAAARRTMLSAWSSSLANAAKGRPWSGAGVRLSSRLNRSISRTTRGSPASARTTWFSGRARPWLSTRNSSSSAPTLGRAGPEAGTLQQPPQGDQALLQPLLEPPVVHRVEPLTIDRQAHRCPAFVTAAAPARGHRRHVDIVDLPGQPALHRDHAVDRAGHLLQGLGLAAAADAAGQADDPVVDLDLDRARREPQQAADDVVEHVEAEIVVGPEEHLEQVRPGHDPDQGAAAVHHRQPLDLAVIHAPGRCRDRLLGPGGHRRGGHQLGGGQAGRLGPLAAVLGGLEHWRVGFAQRCDLLQRQIGLGDHSHHHPAGVVQHRDER